MYAYIPTVAFLGVRCCPARSVASTLQRSQLVETRKWIPDSTISIRNRTPRRLRDLAPYPDPLTRFSLSLQWTMEASICPSLTRSVRSAVCCRCLRRPRRMLDLPAHQHWPNSRQSRSGMLLWVQLIGWLHEWRKNGHVLAQGDKNTQEILNIMYSKCRLVIK